jgi:hypothetical protein
VNPSDTAVADHSAAAFAAAAAAMVTSHDTLGIITRLLLDATSALSADGAGLVISKKDGWLELFASTSHRAEQLELFQLQADEGPCIEATRTGNAIIATSLDDITERWPVLASAFRSTGFTALNAVPMRWHGHTIGAVNVFWNASHDAGDYQSLIQAYADMATIAIVQSEHVTTAQLRDRTRDALAARHAIEQAKGVLAHRDGISMEAAYDRLLERAAGNGVSLSAVATEIIEQAQGQR